MRVPTRPWRQRRAGALDFDADDPAREPYRSLRVQLELAQGARRVIAVTSANRGDGKTTTATALAVELADAGREVILIDLDLRKPDVAGLLQVVPGGGIASLVALDRVLSDALTTVPHVPRLTLVAERAPTGPPTLDLLSARLPTLLTQARALADYVIIDTPPLGEVSDALPVIEFADDVVLVARVGATHESSLEVLRDLIGRAGIDPLGFVIIGTSRRGAGYAYYPHPRRERAVDTGNPFDAAPRTGLKSPSR